MSWCGVCSHCVSLENTTTTHLRSSASLSSVQTRKTGQPQETGRKIRVAENLPVRKPGVGRPSVYKDSGGGSPRAMLGWGHIRVYKGVRETWVYTGGGPSGFCIDNEGKSSVSG